MNKVIVTADNFDAVLASVLNGALTFYVPTCTRVTKINAKTIKSWEEIGRKVIRPASDGKGFRMASGNGSVYVLPGQLVAC